MSSSSSAAPNCADAEWVYRMGKTFREKTVPASCLCDGSLLEHLAMEHVEAFAQLAPEVPLAKPRHFVWGTMCSGSEGCHYVVAAIEKALTSRGIGASFGQGFACELNKQKRAWIHSIVNKGKSEALATCVFEDAADMNGLEAPCHVHQRHCGIPFVDLLVVGTSCKDMSVLNPQKQKKRAAPVLSGTSSKGGSAQTFRNVLGYVSARCPPVVLFENVDAMEMASEACSSTESHGPTCSNADVVVAEFAALGYRSQKFIVDAKEFGLPARRRRLYILFHRKDPTEPLMLKLLPTLVSCCQRCPPCVSEVLLPDDDPAVARELARSLASPGHRNALGEWTNHHVKEYQASGLRWAAHGPSPRVLGSPWFQVLSQREQQTLSYWSAQCPDKIMFNLSQSLARVPMSHKEGGTTERHVAPCMLPRQTMWVDHPGMKAPRLLLGREALALQGFPIARCKETADENSERFMQDLAGNAMSLPVALAILMSALMALPWADRETGEAPASEREDVDEAIALLEKHGVIFSKKAKHS